MTSTVQRILRIKEVQTRTGLGRDSLYRMARIGTFPKIVKIGERASGFLESEVEAFIAERVAMREAPPKPSSQSREGLPFKPCRVKEVGERSPVPCQEKRAHSNEMEPNNE